MTPPDAPTEGEESRKTASKEPGAYAPGNQSAVENVGDQRVEVNGACAPGTRSSSFTILKGDITFEIGEPR